MMFPDHRHLRIALKAIALRGAGHLPPNPTQVHPLRIRTFAWTPHVQAAESPNIKEMPLFQQLAANPTAILAIKDFVQLLKDHGIELSPDRPPSTMKLFKALGNSEIRHGLQKLQNVLEKAGVDVNPENAMQVLEAVRLSNPEAK